jgi:hypothetical protein
MTLKGYGQQETPPMLSKLERLIFWLLEYDWRQFFRLFTGVTHFSLYSSKTTSTVLQLLEPGAAMAALKITVHYYRQ